MTVIRAAYAKWRHLVHELAKFGIVGVVAYLVDLGISNWLHLGLGVGPITSKTVSTVIATVVSYAGNRHWSFAHRAHSGAGRELTGFTVINAIGLVITLACVALARYGLGLKGGLAFNISGNLIGTGLATVFRFWAYKKFVFLHPEVAAARGLGGAVPVGAAVADRGPTARS
jgi:putative flippase GtrA